MAETRKDADATVKETSSDASFVGGKGIKEGESITPAGVQSTTTVTPAEADKTSLPNAMDAKSEDPPVRAARPDTPIAQTLAAGAGAHTPPDPKMFGPDGRPRDKAEAAK